MKKILLLLFFNVYVLNCFSQDFLEVKFSINDIKLQRDNFVKEKIKSVTVKDIYSEEMYLIDVDGKIISKTYKGEYPHTVRYNYHNDNLVGYSNIDYNIYQYDRNGNIQSDYDEGGPVEGGWEEGDKFEYFYDAENRLERKKDKTDLGNCVFEKINYVGILMREIIFPCCGSNDAKRTVYDYSNNDCLTTITEYSKNCSSNLQKEVVYSTEQYFYEGNSKLPIKIIYKSENGTKETVLSYEYY